MKTQKMSLVNMQEKLSRAEMKNIIAGSKQMGMVSDCGGECIGSVGSWDGSCSQADCATYCSSGKCKCN